MNNLLNIKTPAESIAQIRKADYNLSNHSIGNLRLAYWNLVTEALYEEAVFPRRGLYLARWTIHCFYRQTYSALCE